MKTLIITEAVILVVFFSSMIWWMTDFYGLPQKVKCKIGVHDTSVYNTEVQIGMGFFGGPVTTYFWKCRGCGTRGTT